LCRVCHRACALAIRGHDLGVRAAALGAIENFMPTRARCVRIDPSSRGAIGRRETPVFRRAMATRRFRGHRALYTPLDCFASLAMTNLVRPKCNMPQRPNRPKTVKVGWKTPRNTDVLSAKLNPRWRSGDRRGVVAGILRSMSRAIAMKAFTVGDKVCPFYLKTLASNVHKSGGINGRTPVPGPVAAAVTCWIERVNEANEKARRICSGGLSLFCSQRGIGAPG
jgi:hypothetical protein